MGFRLAKKNDLPKLKAVYADIVAHMHENGLTFWNEYYPYEDFSEDIENKNLHLLTEDDEIVAGFCIYESLGCQGCFSWKDKNAKALYIGKVGVNSKFLRQGIASKVLDYFEQTAKKKNIKYLRLTVIDNNLPAQKLYLKHGYKKVDGVFKDYIEPRDITLIDFGFEKEI